MHSFFKDKSDFLRKIKEFLHFFVLLYPALTFISISLAEIVLFSGLILYLLLVLTKRASFEYPKFFIPLLFYAGFSIISAFFSYLPLVSFFTLKDLFLILSIPFIYSVLKEKRESLEKIEYYFFYAVVISSLYSLSQFVFFVVKKMSSPRSYGFESHYMTQAGLMMIIALYSLSLLMNLGKKASYRIYTIFILSSLSLLLTLTRSAWLGFFIAAFILLMMKKPVSVGVLLFSVIIILIISPSPIKKRLNSFLNFKDITLQNRIVMIKKGVRMIKDNPFWGVGPGMVRYAYTVPRYKVKNSEELHSHLHNNFIQIWAARGGLALLSWIFFVIIAFYELIKLKPKDDFFKGIRSGGIFIFLAFLIAGFFEFNFGDSEVLILLFFFLTLPFLYKSKGIK